MHKWYIKIITNNNNIVCGILDGNWSNYELVIKEIFAGDVFCFQDRYKNNQIAVTTSCINVIYISKEEGDIFG